MMGILGWTAAALVVGGVVYYVWDQRRTTRVVVDSAGTPRTYIGRVPVADKGSRQQVNIAGKQYTAETGGGDL